MSDQSMRLKPLNFAMAFGITWGVGMFIFALVAMNCETWGRELIRVMASVYVGFAPTVKGSVIGGIWAFFDGFFGGLVLAWLYNVCGKFCPKS